MRRRFVFNANVSSALEGIVLPALKQILSYLMQMISVDSDGSPIQVSDLMILHLTTGDVCRLNVSLESRQLLLVHVKWWDKMG